MKTKTTFEARRLERLWVERSRCKATAEQLNEDRNLDQKSLGRLSERVFSEHSPQLPTILRLERELVRGYKSLLIKKRVVAAMGS